MTNLSRRTIMLGAAAVPMVQKIAAQGRPKIIAISSANRNNGGINCCAKAVETIKGGGDTLDAVIAGVNIVELDPRDTSVGYGGLPNEEGVVELDASCMHGPSRRGGAVGALRNIKTPSKVAKAIMEQTDHIFLVGEGALKFAKAVGFKEEDLLTDGSRLQWLVWKKSLKDGNNHNNWGPGLSAPPVKKRGALDLDQLKREFPHAGEELLAAAIENAVHPPHGTINCIALNGRGEMSAVTTTSGRAWKIPGRVGDSPIIGGGLWLDQDIGGAGSTGLGEENIRACGAHTVVENMRHGMSPKEAALDALKRVVRNFDSDMERLAQVDLQFYALRKDGEYAGVTLWGPRPGARPAEFAVCTDSGQSHHEPCVYLLERK
ncbi:MAG TPA: N(4)-(beta-N-acetylglucosaminyl)-L-asparaginase [Candidatus Solibacter sp.]|nr:N(4)-(beta-N-acetylglucosaminyl)-L-asparaginase [Candidatus Solibacter sp.]